MPTFKLPLSGDVVLEPHRGNAAGAAIATLAPGKYQ